MVNNGKPETGHTTKAYVALTSFTTRPPFPRETDIGIHDTQTDGPQNRYGSFGEEINQSHRRKENCTNASRESVRRSGCTDPLIIKTRRRVKMSC